MHALVGVKQAPLALHEVANIMRRAPVAVPEVIEHWAGKLNRLEEAIRVAAETLERDGDEHSVGAMLRAALNED